MDTYLNPWTGKITEKDIITVELTKTEHKLLDEIFVSNLAYRDEYIALAKKLGLNSYIDLYEPLERGREI